jgi:7,8-dihydroneopterin aldolase/epimerase/oxygenase
MRFHARVGVLPHEREHPQPIDVDLTVWHERHVEATVSSVVDYRALYDEAARVLATDPELLETIGDRIAEAVLLRHAVSRVRVAVRKPNVALGGPLAYAEVVIDRRTGG